MSTNTDILRPCMEDQYKDQVQALAAVDQDPRPENWQLSPSAVRDFIL